MNIEGKIGKLCMENNKNMTIHLSDNVVGGTLEVIKSSNVKVFCRGEAEVRFVSFLPCPFKSIFLEITPLTAFCFRPVHDCPEDSYSDRQVGEAVAVRVSELHLALQKAPG